MSHTPRWIFWLARLAPGLLAGRSLHRAALDAAGRGEIPLATRLFERAARRYVEDYDADAASRLRSDRRREALRRPAGA